MSNPLAAWLEQKAAALRTQADRLAAEQTDDLRRRVAEAQQALVWYNLADLIDDHRVVVATCPPDKLVYTLAGRCASQLISPTHVEEGLAGAWAQHIGMYYQELFRQMATMGAN